MITPSFSPTATERVLPKLALDFTTASLDSRVTFTRTTDATHPATYINSSGLVANATDNQPRFDYDPVTLACKGLLIEESRANLILSSTYTANTNNWTNGVVGTPGTITSVSITNPAGTTTGVYELAGITGASYVGNFMTVATSTNAYTGSVFVKNNGGQSAQMRIVFSGGTYVGYGTRFDFATETFTDGPGGTTPPTSRSFTKLGNGWYRITITASNNGSVGNTSAQFLLFGGGYTTDYYFWGSQFEVGAFPTSFIPTTSASLTRNADVATMTGTNFSDWYNATQGTFEVEFNRPTLLTTSYARFFNVSDGVGSNDANNIEIFLDTTNYCRTRVRVSSVNQAVGNGSTIYVANTARKAAISYKLDAFAAADNGVQSFTDSSGTVPTVSQVNFGADSSTGLYFLNGWLRKFNYWKQHLIDAETTSVTKS